MSDMDTKVFFERGDEFKDNPIHFAVHRISNMPTYGQLGVAKIRLGNGNVEGCKEKLEQAEAGMVEMITFLREFAKEYDAFKEAGNVIIPKRTKYAISVVDLKKDRIERGDLCYNKTDEDFFLIPEGEGDIFYDPSSTIAVKILIVSNDNIKSGDEVVLSVIENTNSATADCRKIIGKAPQFIIDGLISGLYSEGYKVKVKMRIKEEQIRYTNGEYSRSYQEVEVPEVIKGIVTCEE